MVPGEEKIFFPSIVMTYYKFNPLMIAMNKIVDNYSGSYDLDELKRQFVLLARWYKSIGGAGHRPSARIYEKRRSKHNENNPCFPENRYFKGIEYANNQVAHEG
jgi:hypothetical protein